MRIVLGGFLNLIIITILVSCNRNEDLLPSPTSVIAATPTKQIGYAGKVSSLPAAVQVLDRDGIGINGIEVTFTLLDGEAELHNERMETDNNGTAFSYVTFTDPTVVKIEATVPGLSESVTFEYQVSTSRASMIKVMSGNYQEGLPGETAAESLKVVVTDDFENVASETDVKFLVTEGDGTVSEEVVRTNEEGIAETSFVFSSMGTSNSVAAVTSSDTAFFNLFSLLPSEILFFTKTQKEVTVKWERSQFPAFKEYRLERRSEPYNGFEQVIRLSDIETTEYVDNDLVAGENYEYRLAAVSQHGQEVISSTKSLSFGEFISLDARPADFEFDQERNLLYVSISSLNAIEVIDLATRELKDRLVVGSQPAGISLSHDGSTLYIALQGSGDVAFLDLETMQIKKVSVEDEVGDVKVSDVIEGAPGRVFVTGNPQQSGISYVTVIKTDEGNKVERFLNAVVRFDPILEARYGEKLYLLEEYGFYQLDPYGNYMDGAWGPGRSFDAHTMVLNPAGSELYIGGEVWNTEPFSLRHTYEYGVPAISADGAFVHYQMTFQIRSYNTATFAKTHEVPFRADVHRKFGVTPDGSTFVIFCSDYTWGERLYFVNNE
ncbi:MAG TPA: hypothetical protein VD927_04310 [Chryseosolibacter sp.]|nr:hypothetical protein [Chryseosolibacter sp.]